MERNLCTRAGQPISQLTFGTMEFGGKANAQACRALYEAARATNINHFDTAVGYNEGASETLLGPMVAKDRDNIFLATKVAYHGGAGRNNIQRQTDLSRRQLKLDQIDLLYLHRFDTDTDLKETISTLATLQQNGVIRHIGVSNFSAWQVMKAESIANAMGTSIDAIQPMYNLVKRQAEVEILPMAMDQGVTVVPYSPLGGGLLTGKYDQGATGRLSEDKGYARRYGPSWMHQTASELVALASRYGVAATTLAVAWAARHPSRPHPIIAASSTKQLAPSLAAMEFKMDDALYDAITALSVSPPPATDRLEEA